MTDTEGYGSRPGQTDIERLLEDCRTLSPVGIERVAQGWDQRGSDTSFKEAEEAALRVIDEGHRRDEWDALRNRLLGLTETGESLVAWRVEHGPIGHKAENALLAAAMALTAADRLDARHHGTLVRPMAEALRWLEPQPLR